MAKRAIPKILSLKVTLQNIRPPIWRRILMPATMKLADLHTAIQLAMGWNDSHLHEVNIGGERYGDPATTDDVADENRLSLTALVRSGVTRFVYTYDFGDNWEHAILIEKSPPANAPSVAPACIAGKRHCPPEDCGGPWGYAELLEILANPNHPQHEEQAEWIGDSYDPESFSIAGADKALAAAFRRERPPSA